MRTYQYIISINKKNHQKLSQNKMMSAAMGFFVVMGSKTSSK